MLEAFLRDGVVTYVKDLQCLVCEVGVGWVGLQHVAHLAHVFIRKVGSPEEEDLELVVVLQPKQIKKPKLTAWRRD